MKKYEMGQGIKRYDLFMETYEDGYKDGVRKGLGNIDDLVRDVLALKNRVEHLQDWLESYRNTEVEKCRLAWYDGWDTHAEDDFHNKKTTFEDSQFYIDHILMNHEKNPEKDSSDLDIETIED